MNNKMEGKTKQNKSRNAEQKKEELELMRAATIDAMVDLGLIGNSPVYTTGYGDEKVLVYRGEII